jgi:NADH-quinone oxidoreductase subunit L
VSPEVEAHIHESPPSMTVPLIALAVGSVFAGYIGFPKFLGEGKYLQGFEHWLEPSFASAAVEAAKEAATGASIEGILAAISVAVAIIGILIAYWFYHKRPEIPEAISTRCGPLHPLLYNKYYVDEIYDFLFVDGLGKNGGRVLGAFDRMIVDGGVNGAGWLTRFSASFSMWWDTWIIDGSVRFGSFCVKLLSYPVCLLQSGRVQSYALFIVVGFLAFLGYYVTR